ncbi:hypothetical protein [Streptococcus gordonii]|uniref:hypothetical protein n=1 Tax=Streptococcus gordonii TaxID=1302 RepID=UPI001C8C8A41|nr:hypothetical protein [Streptococcus gordonii]MBX9097667.1 hypothetical protein [Streptococcus gordonii]
MRLYIKSDFTKKIDFTTRELVWKMWFKERNGKKISYSNVGDDEMLQDDFYFGAELRKWASVDKRAMYIMALEIAIAIDGQISEDDKKTWLIIEEFKEKHQDILSLTFDEANEMSLEEIQTIDAIDDPIWEELDKKREEYIQIHGERVYDDEEDE